MPRYQIDAGNLDCTVVFDTQTQREIAICNTYDDGSGQFTTEADHRVRAQAIADALNATGFDYQPEVE